MSKDEKLARIAELLTERVSQREICKQVGCSDWLIQQAIEKHNPPRRLPKGGRKPGELARHKVEFAEWELCPGFAERLSMQWLRKPIRRAA